jgi:hypothetical protein
MMKPKHLLFSAVAGVIAAATLSVTAQAQAVLTEDDAWDTGQGTTVHLLSDSVITANGVDTGVLSQVGNGVVVRLLEAGGGVSDYIYSFGATANTRHIWFLSDLEASAALPPQLAGITLTTYDFMESGSFQSLRSGDNDIFGTEFRVRSDLDPIPEPAAWGLMILGFGAAGAMLRRQRVRLAF